MVGESLPVVFVLSWIGTLANGRVVCGSGMWKVNVEVGTAIAAGGMAVKKGGAATKAGRTAATAGGTAATGGMAETTGGTTAATRKSQQQGQLELIELSVETDEMLDARDRHRSGTSAMVLKVES